MMGGGETRAISGPKKEPPPSGFGAERRRARRLVRRTRETMLHWKSSLLRLVEATPTAEILFPPRKAMTVVIAICRQVGWTPIKASPGYQILFKILHK
jgi:hypothetical protein